MMREDRTKGLFVAFDYTADALREIDAFCRNSGKVIIGLSVAQVGSSSRHASSEASRPCA